MEKTKIIIIILIGLVLIGSVVAYSNRLTISFIINNYKEECYEYKTINETHCRCTTNMQWANWCNTECCHCPNYPIDYREYYNISVPTDECSKYILVRYVK
jgi:hypothetical protein